MGLVDCEFAVATLGVGVGDGVISSCGVGSSFIDPAILNKVLALFTIGLI